MTEYTLTIKTDNQQDLQTFSSALDTRTKLVHLLTAIELDIKDINENFEGLTSNQFHSYLSILSKELSGLLHE